MQRRRNRDRVLAALAVLVLAGVIAAVIVIARGGSGTRTTPPLQQPRQAGSPVSSAPSTPAPPPGSAADISVMDFHGAELPISKTSGPFTVSGETASGFAETPLGAALAAAHLSFRATPDLGPAVFLPTIRSQVALGSGAFEAQVQAQYETARTTRGVAEGQPLQQSTARVTGYRVDDYGVTRPVTVHVLVSTKANAVLVDVPVTVTWSGGDWKLIPPPGGMFSGTQLTSDTGYEHLPGTS